MNAAAAIALAVLAAPGPAEPARKGLNWLARAQQPDGSWRSPGGFYATTSTAWAGLALLMEGSTPKDGEYAPHIRKAMAWFEANAADSGRFEARNSEGDNAFVGHTLGFLFLACAHDADDDPERRARVKKALDRAVAYLIERQTALGGWGANEPPRPDQADSSEATAYALQALLAARRAGIAVPRTVLDSGFRYLTRATNDEGGIIFTLSGGRVPRGRDGTAGAGPLAAGCALMYDGERPEPLARWVRAAGARRPLQNFSFVLNGNGGSSLLQLWMFARAAHGLGDTGPPEPTPARVGGRIRWTEVRAAAFPQLLAAQRPDGSWADAGFGPATATALALLTLQLDNGFVPALAR